MATPTSSRPSKANRREKPLLFVIPGVLMLVFGFGVLLAYSFGGRFTAADSQLIPFGLTTIVVGANLFVDVLYRFIDPRIKNAS